MKNMKLRRVLGAGMAAAVAVSALTGCQKKEVKRDINLADYVELGEYVGIKADKVEAEVYTEEMYEQDILSYLDYRGYYTLEEVTDHEEAQEGDTLQIDYVGTKDGEAFTGGTGSYDLTLGSGAFIEGFEDGLIGTKAGDVVTLELTFPEDYGSADLAGQDVEFEVTVKGIYTKIIDEFTDELAKTLFSYETTDDCKLNIINETNQTNIATAEQQTKDNVLEAVLSNATIKSYPEDLWQEYYDDCYGVYESYAEVYGIELETFLSYYSKTVADLESESTEYANNQTEYYLVMMAIAEAEEMTVSDEEFDAYVAEQAEANSITEDEYLETAGELDIRENILGNKAYDFVMENAVIE